MKSMKNRLRSAVFIVAAVLITPNSWAADAAKGEALYKDKCGGCHDTRIHTRPNRIIHTFEDLVGRVRFCDNAAKADFDETQILDVSEYLNNTFYKFPKEKK